MEHIKKAFHKNSVGKILENIFNVIFIFIMIISLFFWHININPFH